MKVYRIWDKREMQYFSKDFHGQEIFNTIEEADKFAFDWLQKGNYPDYAQDTVIRIDEFELKFLREVHI